MKKSLFTFLVLLFLGIPGKQNQAAANTKPISLDPQNPHYFFYHGKPTLLITSGEHYGAVLNLDFDYKTYLDELKAHGLNLTRTFSGEYIESPASFNIRHNTLAPKHNRFICPWQRVSDENEYKFDLTKWDPAYFKRLKKFVRAAKKRNVIVELTLFCPFYGDEQWKLSPLNAHNNINGWGTMNRTDVYTMDKSGKLLVVEENMVHKIVDELKNFDNVMYEICNEPYFGGVTLEWQRHIAEIINDAEKDFRWQHLITQNIANVKKKINNPSPMVSVFNFHYASPPMAVAQNYHLDKVIGNNETGFKGNKDDTYRKVAWHFILAGGGLFNNLDYSFAVGEEDGTYQYPSTQPGGGSLALRKQLGFLKSFMEHFDFIKMKPDHDFIKNELQDKASVQVLAEKGRQYAIYLSGSAQDQLTVALPQGAYEATWVNPKECTVIKQEEIKATGAQTLLHVPGYKEDIALRLVKKARG
ncbi:MAG TPA: cellulase family glycosylhydrolase [Chitinophagaceae bacterium]|nr:cellulase family glycosylhydrolase [Chitinophagaceae bacterium]